MESSPHWGISRMCGKSGSERIKEDCWLWNMMWPGRFANCISLDEALLMLKKNMENK